MWYISVQAGGVPCLKPFTHLGIYVVHYFTGNVNLKRDRKFLIEICNILGLCDLFFFSQGVNFVALLIIQGNLAAKTQNKLQFRNS